AMRSSLLAAVSHDLRTPLAAITGAVTALQRSASLDPSVDCELLETIAEGSGRLDRLVTNLLDMTRLERGEIRLRREWVPIDELVGGARVAVEKLLAEDAVVTRVDPDLPLLSVDPVLIEQLLVNLLENALRH